jgi:hypothetical protein
MPVVWAEKLPSSRDAPLDLNHTTLCGKDCYIAIQAYTENSSNFAVTDKVGLDISTPHADNINTTGLVIYNFTAESRVTNIPPAVLTGITRGHQTRP